MKLRFDPAVVDPEWTRKSRGGTLSPALMTFQLPANGAFDHAQIVEYARAACPTEWRDKIAYVETEPSVRHDSALPVTVRLWLRAALTETPQTIYPQDLYKPELAKP